MERKLHDSRRFRPTMGGHRQRCVRRESERATTSGWSKAVGAGHLREKMWLLAAPVVLGLAWLNCLWLGRWQWFGFFNKRSGGGWGYINRKGRNKINDTNAESIVESLERGPPTTDFTFLWCFRSQLVGSGECESWQWCPSSLPPGFPVVITYDHYSNSMDDRLRHAP